MKPKLYICLIFFFPVFSLSGQSLEDTWQNEIKYRKTGMTVLGSWAVLNIGTGMALRGNAQGSERYFHDMNAIWNGVNLGIAAFGYFNAVNLQKPSNGLEMYQIQNSLDKTLLFNAGVDFAYIATGLYLNERANRGGENAERFRGYGRSIILQGAFLLVFDAAMVLLHRNIRISDEKMLSINAMPSGFSARLSF